MAKSQRPVVMDKISSSERIISTQKTVCDTYDSFFLATFHDTLILCIEQLLKKLKN